MLPDLKVEAPELEPSPVLLEQLSQLSRLSVPSAERGPRTARALLAAASVTVIAGASWLTGTMPGVASPFSRGPGHGHAQHAPAGPTRAGSGDESAVPSDSVPPAVPPGRAKPHQNNGHHTGQTKPHHNNGNHTGQTKPHHNNGNHTGQTKPHHNNGNHTGQTKPHHNNGNHTGQTKPHHSTSQSGQTKPHPAGGQGGGQGNGNGHRT